MMGIRQLVYSQYGKKVNFPSFADWVERIRDTGQRKDTRTSEQIVNDLIAGLEAIT